MTSSDEDDVEGTDTGSSNAPPPSLLGASPMGRPATALVAAVLTASSERRMPCMRAMFGSAHTPSWVYRRRAHG